MPASPVDILAASRSGVGGKITVGDILALASPSIQRAFNGRIEDETYNYKGFNNITQNTFKLVRCRKDDGTVSQKSEGSGLAPTTLETIQPLIFI